MERNYLILAYYTFTPILDPNLEVELHKAFFQDKDVTCRIYISEEGINGQMSGLKKDAIAYMDWMHSRAGFENVHFKLHEHHENVFPRCTVKYRKQLVALDEKVDIEQGGEHISPQKWKQFLENNDPKILLDVRNDYEWKIGHFKDAELPPCENFRDFNQYALDLKQKVDPQKMPVMMYCTGGIRCELYSAVLKKHGFEKVYQLQGGVINYGLEVGSEHWLGKLFVFDDRLAIAISEDEAPIIGECYHCQKPNDHYYNCANVNCNTLFICCSDCLKEYNGCCKQECTTSDRIRPFNEQCSHKPFKKWYHYLPSKKVK